jgi:hypothetical protein
MVIYKKIILILAIVFISSCGNKEKMETQALIETIFERELERGDTIYLVEDSFSDWISVADAEICNFKLIEDILNWNKNKPVNLSDIYTLTDVEKICRESQVEFKFDQNLVSNKIKVIPIIQIEKMFKEFDKMMKEDNSVIFTKDMERFKTYFEISKPVFTRNYKYAFIYKAHHTFPIESEGPAIFILKKENGEWKILYGGNLFLI